MQVSYPGLVYRKDFCLQQTVTAACVLTLYYNPANGMLCFLSFVLFIIFLSVSGLSPSAALVYCCQAIFTVGSKFYGLHIYIRLYSKKKIFSVKCNECNACGLFGLNSKLNCKDGFTKGTFNY